MGRRLRIALRKPKLSKDKGGVSSPDFHTDHIAFQLRSMAHWYVPLSFMMTPPWLQIETCINTPSSQCSPCSLGGGIPKLDNPVLKASMNALSCLYPPPTHKTNWTKTDCGIIPTWRLEVGIYVGKGGSTKGYIP